MADLPTGTVTFFLTDIEGSTKLWERQPDAMRAAVARHGALAAAIIDQHKGNLLKNRGEGDSLFAVFSRATDAVSAASAFQRALAAEHWATEAPLRVRMALHTGEAEVSDGDYLGPVVNRCARLRAAAHGGQVLLSRSTQEVVHDALPPGASLRDLGTHRLRDLQRSEQIYQLLPPELPADFPPLKSLELYSHNLPVQVTRFIGRQPELATVKELLASSRLLTLTGSGGCGKTRLALQVAADLVEAYEDGVWLVELAAITDPARVPQAVAVALRIWEEPGRPLIGTLVECLRPKRVLLVLDNCEHLLEPCALLADALLRAGPHLRILATSREGLGLMGEQIYRVPCLSFPDSKHLPPPERLQQYEAVKLFADRALLTQPTFALSETNAMPVAQICQRLDGIPLAIELAAARVGTLPMGQIAARLHDRLRLLTGGSRTALPRQQTLRAAIDWSYGLLSRPEQALLRRLSVFSGGWTLEAAEAVCAGERIEPSEVMDLLTRLVDKSLVQWEDRGSEGRYRLLETLRQYGRERLLEAREVEVTRGQHLAYFVGIMEQPHWDDWQAWMDCCEREYDNLRGALEWATERVAQGATDGSGSPIGRGPDVEPHELGLRLGGVLPSFWLVRGRVAEGREQLTRLLAVTQESYERALACHEHSSATKRRLQQLRAAVLRAAGDMASEQGDFECGRSLLEESLSIWQELGDKASVAVCTFEMGLTAREEGDYQRARSLYEQCLALQQELENREGIAHSLNDLGYVAYLEGDYQAARALLEQSLAITRKDRIKSVMGWSLTHLAEVAEALGEYAATKALLEESLAIWYELGYKVGIAYALHKQGRMAWHRGDADEAQLRFAESLVLYRDVGSKRGIFDCLQGTTAVTRAQQPERAARLCGAAERLREAIGYTVAMSVREEYDHEMALLRAALGEEAFTTAWAEGRVMTLERAVACALEENTGT